MDPFLKDVAQKVIGHLEILNNRFSGKTILITGAAGFLGSHFVHYFIQLNESSTLTHPCKVIAWDSFVRSKPDWIEQINNRSDLIFESKDITTERIEISVDFIIHAASIASPVFYRKYPIETMDTNVAGTRNILDYCKTNNVVSLLYLSTSEVYGDPTPENIPTKEEYWGNVNNSGPRACYDESKRFAETLCVNFFRVHNVPVKIVRPFNIYGPGLNPDDGRVISDFLRDAIMKNRVELLSDGKATRTFCYVSDAIEGFLRVLVSDYNGEFFNIGNYGPEISMIELAETVKKICGDSTTINYKESDDVEYTTDNPKRRCASIEKAKTLVRYEPKVALDAGLKATLNYYSHFLKRIDK